MHITPYPNNTMMVKRRTTVSPHLGANSSKHVKRFSTRHSLPAALSRQNGEQEYAPLQEVLEARMPPQSQQHAARAARLRQLSAQLEPTPRAADGDVDRQR